MHPQHWLSLSALLMLLAVALGAFGAHGLESHLNDKQMATWQTAVFYHFVHALALVALSLAQLIQSKFAFKKVKTGLLLGLILFSGSLYLWVITGWQPLVFATPIGGTIWLISWGLLSYQAWRLKPES